MLTPKPTAAEIKAICDLRECGLIEAKDFAFEQWHRSNLADIQKRMANVVQRRMSDDPRTVAQGIIDLIEVIQSAMDDC